MVSSLRARVERIAPDGAARGRAGQAQLRKRFCFTQESDIIAAFSRLPVDRMFFEVGVHGAAYCRIKIGGATEAFE